MDLRNLLSGIKNFINSTYMMIGVRLKKNIDLYKKIFKNKKNRQKLLDFLSFVPDSIMLRIQYFIKLGRMPNLKNPRRFTEKIQKYKLVTNDPEIISCVDKLEVRKFLKKKGLEKYLVKLIDVFNSTEDIGYEKLPNKFVMKTTNGSGGLNIYICEDKSKLDRRFIAENLKLKKINKNSAGREWPYYYIEPKIIVEEYLSDHENPNNELNDYKILCYSGKAKYIIVDTNRYTNHTRNIYTAEWEKLNLKSTDVPTSDNDINRPEKLKEMIDLAEKLSEDFPFVRVDLYNVNSKIYFGELTFFPWSGYVQFDPDSIDFLLGKDFNI